jgi:hypothetical protein
MCFQYTPKIYSFYVRWLAQLGGHLNKKKMFTLTSYNTCIPTPELTIEMTFFDSQLLDGSDDSQYNLVRKKLCEVGGAHNRAGTYLTQAGKTY